MESSVKQVLGKNIWNQERWKLTLKFSSIDQTYGGDNLFDAVDLVGDRWSWSGGLVLWYEEGLFRS